jgi:hypothetical protein
MAKEKKDKRFLLVEQETMSVFADRHISVLCDTKTGVQYLYVANGFGGGLTVLVDKEGKPVINTDGDNS